MNTVGALLGWVIGAVLRLPGMESTIVDGFKVRCPAARRPGTAAFGMPDLDGRR